MRNANGVQVEAEGSSEPNFVRNARCYSPDNARNPHNSYFLLTCLEPVRAKLEIKAQAWRVAEITHM